MIKIKGVDEKMERERGRELEKREIKGRTSLDGGESVTVTDDEMN